MKLSRKSISEIEDRLKETFAGESTGHDWFHIDRVRNMAIHIAKQEGADSTIVELAALLHDIADWKFHGGDDTVGPAKARQLLQEYEVSEEDILRIVSIIETVSFKGAGVKDKTHGLEAKIVQDADRLDAIGAIGVARTFAYGGFKGQEIYNPDIKVHKHETFEEYKNHKGTTVNHFYEKLLLLKDRMHTETAKRIAAKRHRVMIRFLVELDDDLMGYY